MPRDSNVYLRDILEAIADIEEFVGPMSLDHLRRDKKTIHAVVRNLEVIGEAVKQVSEEIRSRYHDVSWRRIAGLRDILIHQYFQIDVEIVWDVVTQKLPELRMQIERILTESSQL